MPREMLTIAKVDDSRKPKKVGVQASDNRWFGVFDQALFPRLVEGANLNVEWKEAGEDGKYRNITAILGAAASSNGTASSAHSKEAMIVREVALKCAVEYHAPSRSGNETPGDVLNTANLFLSWLQLQEDEAPF